MENTQFTTAKLSKMYQMKFKEIYKVFMKPTINNYTAKRENSQIEQYSMVIQGITIL